MSNEPINQLLLSLFLFWIFYLGLWFLNSFCVMTFPWYVPNVSHTEKKKRKEKKKGHSKWRVPYVSMAYPRHVPVFNTATAPIPTCPCFINYIYLEHGEFELRIHYMLCYHIELLTITSSISLSFFGLVVNNPTMASKMSSHNHSLRFSQDI